METRVSETSEFRLGVLDRGRNAGWEGHYGLVGLDS